jgi:hypothetical protein
MENSIEKKINSLKEKNVWAIFVPVLIVLEIITFIADDIPSSYLIFELALLISSVLCLYFAKNKKIKILAFAGLVVFILHYWYFFLY